MVCSTGGALAGTLPGLDCRDGSQTPPSCSSLKCPPAQESETFPFSDDRLALKGGLLTCRPADLPPCPRPCRPVHAGPCRVCAVRTPGMYSHPHGPSRKLAGQKPGREERPPEDRTYLVCALRIPYRTARPSPMWSPPEQGPELRGASHEKGAAPHRAAPPHLYFGITRVFYVAFGQLRFSVWTRSIASFNNPIRCTYRKTLASALARSYRVSVARKAGPNPAI